MSDAVIAELTAQHARLRRLLDRCDVLLGALEDGRADVATLAAEVVRLRQAFVDHQAFEDDHLEVFGPAEGHREHHVELAAALADDPLVRTLAGVLRDLREHLSHEDALLAAVTQAAR